ncbi:MAG: hypothetical protein ACKOUT_08860, partial [Novosphingobium sp.]
PDYLKYATNHPLLQSTGKAIQAIAKHRQIKTCVSHTAAGIVIQAPYRRNTRQAIQEGTEK